MVLASIARTFPVSHPEGAAGVSFSVFILVNFFHQRKKAAEGGSDSHEEKNQQEPRLRIEIAIQEISDPYADGHGKAHFQADAAEPQKLLVRIFILHGAEGPQPFPGFYSSFLMGYPPPSGMLNEYSFKETFISMPMKKMSSLFCPSFAAGWKTSIRVIVSKN